MLELSGACLKDGGPTDFEQRFAAGEITVVLGPNRAGKTDLCRLIAGLPTVARGKVSLDGLEITALKPSERPVSIVYQAFVNYPNLTVADNIASPLRARRMRPAARRHRVGELAEMLQIADLLERLPHELSGGQQQRLAIARALAKDARVLLLDEPLVNLDFKLREALELELRDLLRASGTIVVYTSSDPRDAFSLGDRVLLLADGREIQAGAPVEVYRRPQSFAAMELLSDPCINRFTRAGSACALRPEHIGIGEPAGDALGFDMRVTACETSGDESFIHGKVDGQEWVVRCRGMHAVRADQMLGLTARPADVVSF